MRLFSRKKETRSNVRGKGSKRRLNPVKFDFVYIGQKTFKMFPLDAGEEEKKAWAIMCACAIDEANRRLNRPKKL